jgi:hypothetical protein
MIVIKIFIKKFRWQCKWNIINGAIEINGLRWKWINWFSIISALYDGVINRLYCSKINTQTLLKDLTEVFQIFDKENTGYISPIELKVITLNMVDE